MHLDDDAGCSNSAGAIPVGSAVRPRRASFLALTTMLDLPSGPPFKASWVTPSDDALASANVQPLAPAPLPMLFQHGFLPQRSPARSTTSSPTSSRP